MDVHEEAKKLKFNIVANMLRSVVGNPHAERNPLCSLLFESLNGCTQMHENE